MSSGTTSGRAELAAILDMAAQQDGAIRLLKPKSDATNEPGLFSSTEGRNAQFQKDLIGPMLEEVMTRPRMVKLTEKGIEILVRNTPQDDRPALVSRASELYRARIISAWQKVAIPREKMTLQNSINDHFGSLIEAETDNSDDFKTELARELAASWCEATQEETKNRLSYFLRMAGAESFEEVDSTVTFNSLTHKPNAPLFKGDPALVLQKGWRLSLPNEATIILLKAEVTAAK